MERCIFHCDCNSFYASVELLRHPELKEKCVAVCGDPEGRHGIVLAKNEPAKKMGVKTAEVIWQAKRKCPDLIVLPPHREAYRKYSGIINEIYQQYTDLVEPFGIDESWLDVTGSWHLFAKSPLELADKLRAEVKEKTGLTISVGVSFNKVFAKLGSDYKKPDATTVIARENMCEMVWPLPVSELLYVGKSAQQKLANLGIHTIGQLALAEPEMLGNVLGKLGLELSRYARGEDNAPVRRWGEQEPLKSVGNGTTFRRNIQGPKEIQLALNVLADEVASRLRRHGVWAGAVQVTIRDADLKTITRQKQLPMSTHLARDLAQGCWELVQANWSMLKPIRMLTVTALAITEEPFAVQQSFLEDAPKQDPKREKLEQSLDAIRKKFGRGAIGAGSIINNDLGLGELSIREQQEKPYADLDEKVKGPL